jgi:hypothetical protein
MPIMPGANRFSINPRLNLELTGRGITSGQAVAS